jgi:predicted permease
VLVIDILAPVVLLVLVGWILRRTAFLPPAFFEQGNRLAYWTGLPAFLFVSIAQADIAGTGTLWLSLILIIVAVSLCLLGFLIGLILRLPGPTRASLAQGSFRANLAYVGWPIIAFAGAALPGDAGAELVALAVVAVAPVIPVYNLLSVLVFTLGVGASGAGRSSRLYVNLFLNPLLLACVIAVPWSLLDLPLPLWLIRSGESLGRLALPMALLAIGASLSLGGLRRAGIPAAIAIGLRVAGGPLLTVGLAQLFGIPPAEQAILCIYMACPTAVASYVVAHQLGGDTDLAGAAVVGSTLASLIALAVVLIVMPLG